jgi:hypothetical protein
MLDFLAQGSIIEMREGRERDKRREEMEDYNDFDDWMIYHLVYEQDEDEEEEIDLEEQNNLLEVWNEGIRKIFEPFNNL